MSSGNTIVISADLLIPGRGLPLKNAALVCKGSKIEWVGESASLPDLYHKVKTEHVPVLLPGLWDCHVHFVGADSMSIDHFYTIPQALAGARIAQDAIKVLNAGYTSVRELAGYGYLLNRAIEKGQLEGPTIYSAVSIISPTGGHADCHNTPINAMHDAVAHGLPLQICDGVGECLKAVRMQLRNGAKVIKICASGGVISEADDPHDQQFSDEELRAMVEEAHRARRVVAAHCHGLAGIKAALRAGCTSIEHGTFMDDETLKLMVEKKAILVPTRTIVEAGLSMRDSFTETSWAKLKQTADAHKEMYKRAVAVGVKIALGSDLGVSSSGTPLSHGRNAMELVHAVNAGLSPLQAIEAATATAPETLGAQASLSGQLKEGYDADFIAVSLNPLEEIAVLTNPANITHVWKGARLVKSPFMPTALGSHSTGFEPNI